VLRLAVIGDVHFSTAGPRDSSILLHHSRAILETALEQIARRSPPPDLLIQIGDMVDGSGQTPEETRADLERAVAAFDQTGLRWTWILGNHDVGPCGGRKRVLPHLKRPLSYGELVFGGDVLLLLDSAIEEVFGRVDVGQQAWLEQALAHHSKRRIFVFLHHVFDLSFEDDMYIESGGAIRALLRGSPAVKALFMGHAHVNRIDTVGGLHEIMTCALSVWPLMFRWVEIEPDRLRIQTERVAVTPDVEAEALAAYKANPHSWRTEPRDTDLAADLPLR